MVLPTTSATTNTLSTTNTTTTATTSTTTTNTTTILYPLKQSLGFKGLIKKIDMITV